MKTEPNHVYGTPYVDSLTPEYFTFDSLIHDCDFTSIFSGSLPNRAAVTAREE